MTKGMIAGVLISAMTLSGCAKKGPECGPVWDKNKQLFTENSELKKRVATLESENTQLKGQVQTLSALNPQVRQQALTTVSGITLYKMTAIYMQDANKPGQLVVYLTPTDAKGDGVKAAGSMEIELWNLADSNSPVVGKWQVGPEELNKSWGSTLLSSFYRVAFDLKNLPRPGDFIVRVKFTDYLSGRVFKAEKMVSIIR